MAATSFECFEFLGVYSAVVSPPVFMAFDLPYCDRRHFTRHPGSASTAPCA
jgi:hypothetical protein